MKLIKVEERMIKWQYFFGATYNKGKIFDRYSFAIIDGIRVEKHVNNRRTMYAIGNFDEAKIKHKTEESLLLGLKKISNKKNT